MLDFFIKHIGLSTGFFGVLLLIIAYEVRMRYCSPPLITTQALVIAMNHEKAFVVDIRPSEAFKKGHIMGAHAVAREEILADKTLQEYKEKPVIVVCELGISAKTAAMQLKKNGFTQVSVLDGGMKEWRESHLPVESSSV